MKNRIAKIWGVGLVVILLVSLFGFAAPAAGKTLAFTAETIPSSTGSVILSCDVVDFDASGDTIYAVIGTATLYKSTDAGVSWTSISTTAGGAASIHADLVAVAPDNPDVVAIADNTTPKVHVSTNGGTTWGALGTPQEGTDQGPSELHDLDISGETSGENFVAVAGEEAGNLGNVWYFDVGDAAPAWRETNDKYGFNTGSATDRVVSNVQAALAVAFSPNFASDKVFCVVTGNVASSFASFQMFSTSTLTWNNYAGFGSSYPVLLQNGTSNVSNVTTADISLAPTYLASDDTERVAFVATTANVTTNTGIFRVKDTTDKSLKAGTNFRSVSFDGENLVAGPSASNVVWRSSDPLATTPTVLPSSSLKSPGGETHTVVKYEGANVFAGTTGNESCFAVSTDNGKNFNDIGLIDTALTNLRDFAVSDDGEVLYMATDDGSDASLWRKDGTWERIFCVLAKTDFIVRISPTNPDVIYHIDAGTQTVYFTTDADTKWFARSARYNIQDLAVEDDDVAYCAVSSAATVSKTTNGGFTWGASKATLVVSGNLSTIKVVETDKLMVGSAAGYVSYSLDGNASWTKIPKIVETGGLITQMTASGLEDGDFIYAGTTLDSGAVKRWEVGQSVAVPWKDILGAVASSYEVYGIELMGGALYVCTSDGTDSAVRRTLIPSIAEPAAGYWSDIASAGEIFTSTPRAMRVSSGNNKLWALCSSGTDELYSYSDTLVDLAPTLISPADGATIAMNKVSGKAYDVGFSWARPSEATQYDIWISLDEAHTEVQTIDSNIASTSATISRIIGPDGTTTLVYNPDTTYYWKVRSAVAGPVFSAWSETRSFTIAPLDAPPAAPDLAVTTLSPANGKDNASKTPSFSWSPVAGTTDYTFVLADNVALANPIVDVKVSATGYAKFVELDAGETYYWAVKTASPLEGSFSAVANFTVATPAAAAPPPIVIKEVPPPVINLPAPAPPPPDIIIPPPPPAPAPITPAYIWAIIIIGAVLVIAVIILIVRTRRAV